ncbi:MAG: AraC family transcriptional regulator [Eubacteriales bacterium]|nr:AraC family transcriptional regulator [Eubacteriales bacterium]
MEDSHVLTLENKKNHFQELCLCFCGHSVCYPDHSIQLAAHPKYVLHYILDGKGQFRIDGRTYSLGKDQGFLIEPNTMTAYKADHDDPWRYLWIGFEGSQAKDTLKRLGITPQTPTFSANCGDALFTIIQNIQSYQADDFEQELYIQSQLYQFFACLSHSMANNSLFRQERQNYYVRAAEAFIQEHYAEDIKVQDIANYVGINRSYLATLFQRVLQMSPNRYLSNFRLTRGQEQLAISDLPISSIAELCGYHDPLVFSKAFKQLFGVTPTQYRHNIREQFKMSLE